MVELVVLLLRHEAHSDDVQTVTDAQPGATSQSASHCHIVLLSNGLVAELAHGQVLVDHVLRLLEQRRSRSVLELISRVLEVKSFPSRVLERLIRLVVDKHHVLGFLDHW